MKLLLIDGSNLFFQMFYGMPSRIINEDGIAIQGVIGFIGALRKILSMTSPTHLAVLFDGECQNERRALDADYKANRPDFAALPEEDTPFSQLPYIQSALTLLGIPYKETETCEADDWIATFAATYGCENSENEVFISSFDSDFFQLISPSVSVLRYRGDASVICTPDYIKEKFGILPSQYADYKSLVGDTSDNIKGIPSIGPKTAARLLSAFGSIEGIYGHLDEITPPRLQNALSEDKERLILNQRLITLTGTVPLPFTEDELRYVHTPFTTSDVLIALGLKKKPQT